MTWGDPRKAWGIDVQDGGIRFKELMSNTVMRGDLGASSPCDAQGREDAHFISSVPAIESHLPPRAVEIDFQLTPNPNFVQPGGVKRRWRGPAPFEVDRFFPRVAAFGP